MSTNPSVLTGKTVIILYIKWLQKHYAFSTFSYNMHLDIDIGTAPRFTFYVQYKILTRGIL